MTDPFDALRTHVRAVALLERPTTTPDDLIDTITGASPSAPVIVLHARRRRWLAAGGAVAIVVAGSAGVAAFRGERPAITTADVVCRSAAAADSSAQVIEPDGDPVESCRALWARGDLPDVGGSSSGVKPAVVPPLVACTGRNGSIEVFPMAASGCAELGMEYADASGIEADPVFVLQERLSEALNAGECRSSRAAEEQVLIELERGLLTNWSVLTADPASACVRVAVVAETRTINLFPDPSFTPEETP